MILLPCAQKKRRLCKPPKKNKNRYMDEKKVPYLLLLTQELGIIFLNFIKE